jgi:hypothetical protein
MAASLKKNCLQYCTGFGISATSCKMQATIEWHRDPALQAGGEIILAQNVGWPRRNSSCCQEC